MTDLEAGKTLPNVESTTLPVTIAEPSDPSFQNPPDDVEQQLDNSTTESFFSERNRHEDDLLLEYRKAQDEFSYAKDPNATKDAKSYAQFKDMNERIYMTHLIREPSWLREDKKPPGPGDVKDYEYKMFKSSVIQSYPQDWTDSNISIFTESTETLQAYFTRWSTICKMLVHLHRTHCNKHVNPPRFRPELLEAVFGQEFSHYCSTFSSHELHYSCGLMLVPLLRNVLIYLIPDGEGCTSDILDRVVDLTIGIARYVGNRENYGSWTLKNLDEHLRTLGLLNRAPNLIILVFGVFPLAGCRGLWEVISSVNSHSNPYSKEMSESRIPIIGKLVSPIGRLLTVLDDVAPMIESFPASNTPTFSTGDVHYLALLALGGIRIRWTQFFPEHLQLDPKGTELAVFWNLSLVRTSPYPHRRPSSLFWLAGNSSLYGDNPRTGGYRPQSLEEELQATYALLFGYPKEQATKLFESPDSELGICLDPVYTRSDPATGKERATPELLYPGRKRVDPTRGIAKKLLAGYLRLPAPLRATYLHPKTNLNIDYESLEYLRTQRIAPLGHSMTIEGLLEPGPPYPIDILMHMKAILNNPLEEIEAFSQYPMFGDRLRQLKALMDQRKPRTWKQLWTDRRDAVNYYTFWSVVTFGTVTTMLALVSLAVSTAQTMASFRQLEQGNRGS